MKLLFPRRSRWLAILAMAATSTNPVASIALDALDALDEAMLTDLLQAYEKTSSASCTQESGSTTFSFDWPGNNANSTWSSATSNHEELKFQAIMSHQDANGRSWDARFGTGGDMYSHYTPDMYGETIPPQTKPDSPWIDEVQQSVSVNTVINKMTAYPDWCTRPISNKDNCKWYYIHQAGAYMRDTGYTDTTPFYSPSLAKHCSGNACMFASWGTQAQVVTPFTSPVIYIHKYTNCGNGIIEHDQVIHNFAPASASIPFTTQSYFNIGWGGVRTSTLPIALEANGASGALNYTINNENYLKTCKWGLDEGSGDDTATPGWRGERKYTRRLGGYTTFAGNDLLLNYTADPWEIPCRTSMDSTCSNAATCMVDSCTDAEVAAGYKRVQLQVGAGQKPRCWDYGPRDGHTIIQCELREAGERFGHSSPTAISYDKCAPWTKIGFKIRGTDGIDGIFPVTFFLHYSYSPLNNKVYFATNITSSWHARTAASNFFDNTGQSTTMYIDVVDMSSERATSPPDDYDPDNINAFTFVYGKAPDPERRSWERRRLGWSERDYTVFTINWLGGNARLQAGETLIKRGFYFVSNLASVKATGDDLHPKSFLDKIPLEGWSPRAVDIYQSGDYFAVMAAATSGGTSTECAANPTPTKPCSGFSTPTANYVPFFYITCGTSTYFGPDPYHFTPAFGAAQFPAHGTKSNFVRSYVCHGLALSVRPTWKMMGFFDPTNTGCTGTALSSAKYNESEFTCPTGPTSSPTKSPTQTPSVSPTTAPTSPPTTPQPTSSPTKSPTQTPSVSPTTAPTSPPTTPQPTSSPTEAPTPPPKTPQPTSRPTEAPTHRPTKSPTTNRPTTAPGRQVVIAAKTTFDNIDAAAYTPETKKIFEQEIKSVIENAACPASTSVQACTVKILTINGTPVNSRVRRRRHLLSRKLQSSLLVEYEVILEAICAVSECSDPQAVQEIANAVYAQVTNDLKAAIDNGSLIEDLKQSSDGVAALLENAASTGDFSPVVIPVLSLLSDWYPDWVGQTKMCKNDGKEPMYMKLLGTYYEKSIDACCKRFYSWDISTCNGGSGTSATLKWFVNHREEICQQDCLEAATNAKCGGLAQTWVELYESAKDCCAKRLSWVPAGTCQAKSTLTPVVGSNLWYADYALGKCVKDCEDSSDAQCRGFAKPWDQIYSSASDCCDRIWWIQRSKCTI